MFTQEHLSDIRTRINEANVSIDCGFKITGVYHLDNESLFIRSLYVDGIAKSYTEAVDLINKGAAEYNKRKWRLDISPADKKEFKDIFDKLFSGQYKQTLSPVDKISINLFCKVYGYMLICEDRKEFDYDDLKNIIKRIQAYYTLDYASTDGPQFLVDNLKIIVDVNDDSIEYRLCDKSWDEESVGLKTFIDGINSWANGCLINK